MSQKIKALLWKDVSYRFKVSSVISLVLLIVCGFLANLEVLTWLSYCRIGHISSMQLFGPKLKCASDPSDGLDSKILAYEPSSPFLKKLMENAACLLGLDNTNVRQGLDSKFDFGVRFKGIIPNQIEAPELLDYVLYPASDSDLNPKARLNLFKHEENKAPSIEKIKMAIDIGFNRMKNVSLHELSGAPQPLQDLNCISGSYRAIYKVLLPFLMFFLESNRFFWCIVEERNAGIQEFVKLMGLKLWQIRFSEFFITIATHLLAVFISLFFLHVKIAKYSVVYFYIGTGTMFCYFFICTLYISAFNYMKSFFFRNGHLGTLIDFVLWISSLVFFGSIEYNVHVSTYLLIPVSLIPQFWCLEGFALLSKFQQEGHSVEFYENKSPGQSYLRIRDFFLIGIFGTVFYIVVGAYLENVLPGKYGRSLPLHYIFKRTFWSQETVKTVAVTERVPDERQNTNFFEQRPQNLPVGISVHNLNKMYSWKTKKGVLALNNINFEFYENEITGILGHNGAGKTTLFSILCGMMTPTSGNVIMKGIDITNSRDNKKGNIGYCPQFEILLDGLSVYRNLIFFGMAKNLSRCKAAQEAESLMLKLKLLDCKKVRASNLSGGLRKKLSLGIALIGEPPVIILDEPSTGIDIVIRREIWELLLDLRGKRTVILSIHFMEEADALCDRIGVIWKGQIKCHGTPMFLKSKFGTGYTLSVVIQDKEKANSVTNLVKSKVRGAILMRQNVLTLTYQLFEKEMSVFPDLFNALDNKIKDTEVVSYKVAVSTMEDVFLNISDIIKEEEAAKKGVDQTGFNAYSISEDFPKRRILKGIPLFFNQLGALLIKKWIFFYRNITLIFVLGGTLLALDAVFDIFVNEIDITYFEPKIIPYFIRKRDDYLRLLILRFHFFFIIYFALEIWQERQAKLKSFQLMLVSPILYWLTHIFFDFPLFVAHAILSYIILAASNETAEKFIMNNLGRIAVGLLYHHFCMLMITYLAAMTYRRLIAIIITPVLLFLISFFFSYNVVSAFFFIWREIFPTVHLFDLLNTDRRELECKRRGEYPDPDPDLGPDYDPDPDADWYHYCRVQDQLEVIMICYFIAVLLLPLLIDIGVLPFVWHKLMTYICRHKFEPNNSKDASVEREEENIKQLKLQKQLSSKVLTVDNVKYWSCWPKIAVEGISFTIKEKECFGLVGVDKAEKTTIFKILTGMKLPTYGNAYVRSTSVLNFCLTQKTLSKLGCCPQSGGYIPKFTGREMIELFGRLRGMRGSHLKTEVDRLVKEAVLQDYEGRQCSTYSSGALRKLVVILAMIGEPMVLLLDEPTTGIDPASRRLIWNLLTKYRESGHSVLLASQSMDECEALCSRLGIMEKGRLLCIREATTLKNLFGQFYSVVLVTHLTATDEDRGRLKKAMTDAFGSGCQLKDELLSGMQYQIPTEKTNWKKLFSELNAMKSKYSFLESFSAGSTTLEQAFLNFSQPASVII